MRFYEAPRAKNKKVFSELIGLEELNIDEN